MGRHLATKNVLLLVLNNKVAGELWVAGESRFAAVRASDKYRGAFEPVSEDLNAARDNQYIGLDKQNVHLASKVKQHPTLLVCVLRRSNASKQLDLHAFVCGSPQHAVAFTNNLQLLHSWSVAKPSITTT